GLACSVWCPRVWDPASPALCSTRVHPERGGMSGVRHHRRLYARGGATGCESEVAVASKEALRARGRRLLEMIHSLYSSRRLYARGGATLQMTTSLSVMPEALRARGRHCQWYTYVHDTYRRLYARGGATPPAR